MTDVHTSVIRSYNMSQIKGKNTRPEMLVRRFLHANGYRYSLHVKYLVGKPDIVMPKYNILIFINGCFWHGHQFCKYYVVPKTKTEWWLHKIQSNKNNDEKVIETLKSQNWRTIVIWECELKKDKFYTTMNNLIQFIKGNEYTK